MAGPSVGALIVGNGERPEYVAEAEASVRQPASPPVVALTVNHPGEWGEKVVEGLDRLRTDVVAFLDADDYWLPGKVAAVQRAFSSAEVVSFVHHSTTRYENGTAPARWEVRRGLGGFFPNNSCYALRRSLLLRALPWIPRITASMDRFMEELGRVGGGRVVATTEPLTIIRVHGSNVSRAPLWSLAHRGVARKRAASERAIAEMREALAP